MTKQNSRFIKPSKREISTQASPQCSEEGDNTDAEYCKYCGAKL